MNLINIRSRLLAKADGQADDFTYWGVLKVINKIFPGSNF